MACPPPLPVRPAAAAPRPPAHGAVRRSLLLGAAALLAGCAGPPRAPVPPPATARPPLLDAEQAGDVAIHALGLVGTPYRFGGNTPEGGFDCSGLISYVYRSRVGIAPPRTVAALGQFGQPLAADAARSGDLVLFGSPTPTHAGIYVGEGRFVHAPSTGGTVRLDHLAARHWAREFAGFRRI